MNSLVVALQSAEPLGSTEGLVFRLRSDPMDEPQGPHDLQSTIELLEMARGGDRDAVERLCARYLPRLRLWTTGRLPHAARDLLETDDVISEVLVRTVQRVEKFEPRSIGEFHSYLRRSLTNRIRDEVRRVQRKPQSEQLNDDEAARGPSPIEELIGREQVERYEAALQRLKPEEREAVVARIEMGCTYREVAETLGKPSEDAARMAVTRAVVRLAEEIKRGA